MSYAALIQKDLPLITWALNDATLTSGSTAASDRFFSGNQPSGIAYTGTYNATVSAKSFPIIYGSPQSIEIPSTSNTLYLTVPTLDRFSSKANTSSTLEFWFKPTDASFAVPTSTTKIVKKKNSNTGVYIQNSSIIAMVGDAYGNTFKVSVPVENIRKPMHIAFSITPNSLSLSVNGKQESAQINSNPFTSTYLASNEYFEFYSIGAAYAIDHIALYSKALDLATIRRHVAYGLGYEIPKQVASSFGGVKYNFSMNSTPISYLYQKGDTQTWNDAYSISNMEVKDGVLQISQKKTPFLKSTEDSSGFTWTSTYVTAADGSYIEIEDSRDVNSSDNGGIGFVFERPDAIVPNGTTQTLVWVSNPIDEERYMRFYITATSGNETVAVDINGTVTNLITATGKLSSSFSVAYFYDVSTNTLTAYAGTTQSVTGVRFVSVVDSQFYSGAIRLLSTPSYSKNELASDFTSTEKNHSGAGVRKIVDLLTAPTTTSATTIMNTIDSASIINEYCAIANVTEKRFIVSANGSYQFNIDVSSLCGTNGFIGNHFYEWGTDSPELTVRADWYGATGDSLPSAVASLSNRSSTAAWVSQSPGIGKHIRITFTVQAKDVVENNTKIPYFRFYTYKTSLSGSNYNTTIISPDGPDIVVSSTTSSSAVFPPREETPFLFNEESGGLMVGASATIFYDYTTIRSDLSTNGITAVSFMLRTTQSSGSVITIANGTTVLATLSLSSATNLTSSGAAATIYTNGSGTAGGTIVSGRWNHIIVVFTSRQASTDLRINFFPNHSYDEFITIDDSLTAARTQMINRLMKGTNVVTSGSTAVGVNATNTISVRDSEFSNGAYMFQNFGTQASTGNPFLINLVSTKSYTLSGSGPFTIAYSTLKDTVFDGITASVGDYILLKNQSTASQNGVYQVTAISKSSNTMTLSKQSDVNYPLNCIVYVREGVQNEGRMYLRSATNVWVETYALEKIVAYVVPKTIKSDIVVEVEALVD